MTTGEKLPVSLNLFIAETHNELPQDARLSFVHMRQKDQPDFILLGSHEVGKPAKRLIQQYEDMFGKKIDLDALVFLNTGHLFGKGSQYYILHAVEEGLHYPTKSGSSRTMSR